MANLKRKLVPLDFRPHKLPSRGSKEEVKIALPIVTSTKNVFQLIGLTWSYF